MSAKSDYLEKKVLDHFLGTSSTSAPSAVYLSLHTSSPGETDGNEISGNGYSRQTIAFDAAHATNGTAANSDTETFTASGGDFGTITHFGIHDASSAGNLLYYGALTASKAIADGDTLSFAAGSIVITEA
tara:strand:+ start:6228 stop:6617 length:390 start_codon:yes stop_codon:yes gene_type:complete